MDRDKRTESKQIKLETRKNLFLNTLLNDKDVCWHDHVLLQQDSKDKLHL